MPVIVTVCLVVTTAALVALAIVTIRTMIRFENMAEQIETTAQMFCDSMADVKVATREIRELALSLQDATQPVRDAAAKLGKVGDRAAGISSAVLDELETPVRAAIGVYRGLRAGSTSLLGRIRERIRANGGQG